MVPAGQLQSGDAASLLTDLAARFTPSPANDYESGLDEILAPLFSKWNAHLLGHKLDIGGGGGAPGSVGYREILNAVQTLSEIKAVAACLPTLKGWDAATEPGAAANELEYRSVLGPLLRLSAFPDGAVRRLSPPLFSCLRAPSASQGQPQTDVCEWDRSRPSHWRTSPSRARWAAATSTARAPVCAAR